MKEDKHNLIVDLIEVAEKHGLIFNGLDEYDIGTENAYVNIRLDVKDDI